MTTHTSNTRTGSPWLRRLPMPSMPLVTTEPASLSATPAHEEENTMPRPRKDTSDSSEKVRRPRRPLAERLDDVSDSKLKEMFDKATLTLAAIKHEAAKRLASRSGTLESMVDKE